MAKTQQLAIVFSRVALRELNEIWDWNVERNGQQQASAYIDFLRQHISALAKGYERGRAVSTRPDLRFISIQWPKAKHKHIAVYHIDLQAQQVIIAHVFHSRQNWEQTLEEEGS